MKIKFNLIRKSLRVMLLSTTGLWLMALPASAAPFAYVTNGISNDVTVIDASTNTVVIQSIPVGKSPNQGVAITPDGKWVYVANVLSGNVSVISTLTNTVATTITVGSLSQDLAITPDGKRVYVSNYGTNDVSVIDTLSNTVIIPSIPVGSVPWGVAITPDGKRVYVVNWNSNDVSVIDTPSNTVVVQSIPVGINPRAIAIRPDGKQVYVANVGGNVSVIDTLTNSVTKTIPAGTWPEDLAISPDGTRLYVANRTSNDVTVIDTINNTVVIPSIFEGLTPQAISITPDGKQLYVANSGGNNVSVIDTLTNSVTKTIPVGSVPSGVAITPLPTTISATFNVSLLSIEQRYGVAFMLSTFTLGQSSNGINPANEPITLQVGNATLTIPIGSFKKSRLGLFNFVGHIGNLPAEALITPLGYNRFGFQIAIYGADLSGITNPVQVQLTIGDDSGITSVNASIQK